tara:strand:+ start:492 stop:1994 length:1503 start_codon:yes stop_codon:yes gene_type:complete
MGLLDDSLQQYYQGSDYGNYQFISLDDVITQFQIAYVGEGKIISKVNKLDIAFHAQRALQELSFDTFKSTKAQEIVVPASLQMILPHDYVNYTKISWSDSAGIKHPLYPTSSTSNPFSVSQDVDGNYVFPSNFAIGVNMDFSDPLQPPWLANTPASSHYNSSTQNDTITLPNGLLTFTQHVQAGFDWNQSRIYSVWQEIDVTGMSSLELSALGSAQAAATDIVGGTLKIGITGISPNDYNPNGYITVYSNSSQSSPSLNPPWLQTLNANDGYLEWVNGESSTEELVDNDAVDVSGYEKIYVVITSRSSFSTTNTTPQTTLASLTATNTIDDIVVTNTSSMSALSSGTGESSATWNNYKSGTPSENQDDYQDDTYWPMDGSRYGLDPQHAQVNGSFYINNRLGKIHFSSNISGKTVILDYISDSLGTDSEMQVHKFAEEAMYKWIAHAILSTSSSQIHQQLAPRFKKERFAAVRTAKLRLSNIKLEELTQILRGKSKQIKH